MGRSLLYLLMIFAMIAWGETWVSAKILGSYLGAKELVFWRFFFTSVGMLFVMASLRISLVESPKEISIAFVGALILSLYNGFFFLGTRYGLASFGGVFVTTLTPIVTFLLVALRSGRRLKMPEYAGLGMGTAGAVLMLRLWSFDTSALFAPGNLYFLLAAFTWPVLTIVSSTHRMKSAIVFSFYLFAFTTLIDYAALGFDLSDIRSFDGTFWLHLLLLSLWGTTFATTTFFLAVERLGSSVASSYFFVVPLSALLFSFLVLGERVDWNLLLGGAMSVAAVTLLNLSEKIPDKDRQ